MATWPGLLLHYVYAIMCCHSPSLLGMLTNLKLNELQQSMLPSFKRDNKSHLFHQQRTALRPTAQQHSQSVAITPAWMVAAATLS
jgi:hypothetical protein